MIWFILTTIVTYIIYYLFIIRKYDATGKRIVKEKKLKKKNVKVQTKKKKEIDQAKYPAEV